MKIGFIGLGNMGLPMARRLVAAGHDLVVCDLDPAPVQQLVDAGAKAAASPRAVADRAETILVSLPTPAVLQAVALGEDGIAGGERVRRVVDLSTVGPAVSRQVADGLAQHGVALVDSPVSGGVAGATNGTLAVMASGAEVDLAVAEPLLSEIGRYLVVGDEPGMGQVMKLVNNYLSATALAATSEALVYGAKAGLDPAVMIEVANAGSGRNSATQDKFPNQVLPGTFASGFAIGLMCKDLKLFTEDAEARQVPLFVGSAVRQIWQHASDRRGAEVDFTEIVRPLEEWTGTEVRSERDGAA
ncbi:MAG: NAD(P)-dependent oxidoreductase [Patulibacter sp.]|nr:NAD(P)-dependent oxidoreductase [Patulibacter sp.]